MPAIGGGVARFDWRGVPIFRPWDGITHDPNALGCYPLVPWSNRISGGGIDAGGRFWPLQPNWPGEPYPIHGDGWRTTLAGRASTPTAKIVPDAGQHGRSRHSTTVLS